MKKPIAQVLVKRKFFIALLFLFNAFIGNAQWTYTTTVKQTGRCIPYPTLGPIPYYTKSACEAARQSDLSNSGSDWSTFGDGSCTTIITCTPCVGSDIGNSGQGSSPGQGSLPGQTNPGDVSLQGPLNGNPFFTPHQSQAFEEWASEYKQLLASYGITSILGKNFTIPRTPLTDDNYFNAAYTNLVINYTPKTAPVSSTRTEPASTPKEKPLDTPKTEPVNPSNTEFPSITMPIMGNSPLTQADRERQIIEKEVGHKIGYDQYAWNTITDGSMNENTPPEVSFPDKLLDYSKDATESSYSKWVGNIANVVCSNASAAAYILGSGDQPTLTSQVEMQFDASTVIFKASLITIVDEVTDRGIGFVVDKAISAVNYVGEKTIIKLCPNVSQDVVKMDYRNGLVIGKKILEYSETAKKFLEEYRKK